MPVVQGWVGEIATDHLVIVLLDAAFPLVEPAWGKQKPEPIVCTRLSEAALSPVHLTKSSSSENLVHLSPC